jgi:hypothetical protein
MKMTMIMIIMIIITYVSRGSLARKFSGKAPNTHIYIYIYIYITMYMYK